MNYKTNMTLTLNNILKEKRKRFQTYTALDYLISMTTPFDFFSKETFEIFLYSLYLHTILKPKNFSYTLFFISCLEKGTISKEILIQNNLTFENLTEILEFQENSNRIKKEKRAKKDLIVFDNLFYFDFQKITLFLNKILENAHNRFKTPLISEEIFLITLLELIKNDKNFNFFLPAISNVNYLNIRYKLLKKLHSIETALKIKTPQNFLFFSYLVQTQLSSFESKNLIFTEDQTSGLSFFRNKLILECLCLSFNINSHLKKRIHQNISSYRNYSIK